MSFPKRCSCGRVYSRVEWEALRFVGIHVGIDERLDLRNCACKSTMAVELPEDVSVCAACGSWIENETKTVTEAGAHCSECGPAAAKVA